MLRHAWITWIMLLAQLWVVTAEGQATLAAAEDAVYAYTDDRGQLVYVQRLEDIPLGLRDVARRVDVEAPPDSGLRRAWEKVSQTLTGTPLGTATPPPVMFRYRGPNGRDVYTNLAASVPPGQREQALIDLRQVSLNSALGAELDQQLKQRFESLRSSSTCDQLREQAQTRGFWQELWSRPRPLVACGAVLLLLVLVAPWMASRGWGAQWARVLGTAIPLLGFVGLSAYLIMQAQGRLQTLAPRAERCEAGAWERAPDLPKRFALVSALEAEQAALARIEQESRP
jgi:hypothetical protein